MGREGRRSTRRGRRALAWQRPTEHDAVAKASIRHPRRGRKRGANASRVRAMLRGRGKGVQGVEGPAIANASVRSAGISRGRALRPWIPFPSLRSAGDDSRRFWSKAGHDGDGPCGSPQRRDALLHLSPAGRGEGGRVRGPSFILRVSPPHPSRCRSTTSPRRGEVKGAPFSLRAGRLNTNPAASWPGLSRPSTT